MTIEVTTSKPYLAKVTGLSKKFGTRNEFITEAERRSHGFRVYCVSEDGIYKCPAGDTRVEGIGRIDTGFFRVEAGVAKEITKDEVLTQMAQ